VGLEVTLEGLIEEGRNAKYGNSMGRCREVSVADGQEE
jgi:hypothetical protein